MPLETQNISSSLADSLESAILALLPVGRTLDTGEDAPCPEGDNWRVSLERRVLPRLRGDFPLIVGFCGGGNTGKSTLFNALAGLPPQQGSATGPRAGLTRKALLAIPRAVFDSRLELRQSLFDRFGGLPAPYDPAVQPSPMTEPGPPLYIVTESGLPDAILVDIPDVDVASNSGGYANRENSRQLLAACDLLLLIAVNQTYSNKDITDFMRETVFAEGLRPAMLIYRYGVDVGDGGGMPREDEEHVRNAFATMGALLYPGIPHPPVHGCFLMREEALVRTGAAPDIVEFPSGSTSPVPRSGGGAGVLREALARVDRRALYREATARAIDSALDSASRTLERCREKREAVEKFQAALDNATEYYARGSLTAFPSRELQAELAECWREEQNFFHRASGALGRAASAAGKKLAGIFGKTASGQPDEGQAQIEKGRNDFLAACADLRRFLTAGGLEPPSTAWDAKGGVHNRMAPMPGLYEKCRLALETRPFEGKCADELSEAWRNALHLPPDIREVIRPYVKEARARMSGSDVAKEYAKSLIGAGCQMAAITYVIGTGGATLLIFGGNDLYALLAIPAVIGCEHMPEDWRAKIWNDILRRWSDAQALSLVKAIKGHISGDFLKAGAEALAEIEAPIGRAREALEKSRGLFAEWSTGEMPREGVAP